MAERCPRCGSDRIEQVKKQRRCKECSFLGTANKFQGLTVEYPKWKPNEHWRDPVAMSMDGYEDEV